MALKMGRQDDGTFLVYAADMEQISHRVGILNRRVEKTGSKGLGYEIVERLSVGKGEKIIPLARVRITGEVPVIAGHKFIARVEHHGEVGNIISKAPGSEAVGLPEYRTAKPECDHCKVNRRRNDTFVIETPEGALRQIGRNCLADFIRTADAELALRMFALHASIAGLMSGDGEPSLSGGGKEYTSTTHFLATTCAVIRTCGWVSKKEAWNSEKRATADLVSFATSPKPTYSGSRLQEEWTEMQPNEGDFEEAAEVAEWAGALAERTDLNDYLHNLRVSVSLGYVGAQHMGIVASAVPAHRREKAALLEAATRAVKGAGEHVGAIGKRMVFEGLTVMRVNTKPGDYGVTTIVTLEDAAGNELTWFASGDKPFKIGQKVSGKGTVTKHGEFKGRKTTTVNRCTFE